MVISTFRREWQAGQALVSDSYQFLFFALIFTP